MNQEWTYRGEGNHNVVIANTQKLFVYRLAKHHSVTNGAPAVDSDKQVKEFIRKKLERRVQFARHVISPLIGQHYLCPGELVELEPEFISNICENVIGKTERDVKYCPEHVGELVYPLAWKLPDFCFHANGYNINNNNNNIGDNACTPTFTIEIKPSVLFIGNGSKADDGIPTTRQPCADLCDVLSQDDESFSESHKKLESLRQSMCRHCFTNQIKVRTGVWQQASRSCPVDLVSGDQERMKFALTDLFITPHHRLKIYKNGGTIFSRDVQHGLEKHLQPFFGYQADAGIISAKDHLIEVVMKSLALPPTQAAHSTIHEFHRPDGSLLKPSPCEQCSAKQDIDIACTRCIQPTYACTVHSVCRNGPTPGVGVGRSEDIVNGRGTCRHLHDKIATECEQQDSDTLTSSTPSRLSHCGIPQPSAAVNGASLRSPQPQLASVAEAASDHWHDYRATISHRICSASPFSDVVCSTPGVPDGCVLDIVRFAQMCSKLTILTVYPYYLRVSRHFQQHPRDRRKYCMDGPYDTEAWQAIVRDPDLLHCPDHNSIQYAIKKVQQFLIYLALKGSSIMITLQPQSTHELSHAFPAEGASHHPLPVHLVPDSRGNKFKVSISVIDLDPKPIEKIQRMYLRDNKDVELLND